MCKPVTLSFVLLITACASNSNKQPSNVNSSLISQPRPKVAAATYSAKVMSGFFQPATVNSTDTAALINEYKRDYQETDDIETKCDLLIAIAEIDKSNPDFFLTALQDKEARIRQEAAIQLKNMVTHADVQRALVIALDDPSDDVLLEVIEAVSTLHTPAIYKKLMDIAQTHSDKLIREVAADYATGLQSISQ